MSRNEDLNKYLYAKRCKYLRDTGTEISTMEMLAIAQEYNATLGLPESEVRSVVKSVLKNPITTTTTPTNDRKRSDAQEVVLTGQFTKIFDTKIAKNGNPFIFAYFKDEHGKDYKVFIFDRKIIDGDILKERVKGGYIFTKGRSDNELKFSLEKSDG